MNTNNLIQVEFVLTKPYSTEAPEVYTYYFERTIDDLKSIIEQCKLYTTAYSVMTTAYLRGTMIVHVILQDGKLNVQKTHNVNLLSWLSGYPHIDDINNA